MEALARRLLCFLILALSLKNCWGAENPPLEFSFKEPDTACRHDFSSHACCDDLPNVLNKEVVPKNLLLILGPLKTGSNFLFNALSKHPSIRGAKQKETFYFLRAGHHHSAIDLKDYMKFWPKGGDHEKDVFLEASVAYFMSQQIPCLIKHSAPHAKFIVLLRDPVARMWSYIDMIRRKCVKFQKLFNKWYGCDEIFKSFSEIVEREMDGLDCDTQCRFDNPQEPHSWTQCSLARKMQIVNGIYAPQVAHWFKFFDPSQFLFLRSEDLTSDTANQVNKVLDFVGLPRGSYPGVDRASVFSYSGEYMWKDATLVDTQDRLNRFYQRTNDELMKYLSLNGHNMSIWRSEELKSGDWEFPKGMVQSTFQGAFLWFRAHALFLWMVLAMCAWGTGWCWWKVVQKDCIKKGATLRWWQVLKNKFINKDTKLTL